MDLWTYQNTEVQNYAYILVLFMSVFKCYVWPERLEVLENIYLKENYLDLGGNQPGHDINIIKQMLR